MGRETEWVFPDPFTADKIRPIKELLQRIEELEADLADLRNIAEAAVAMLQVCQADLRECQRENQRLREAL